MYNHQVNTRKNKIIKIFAYSKRWHRKRKGNIKQVGQIGNKYINGAYEPKYLVITFITCK